MIGLAVQFVTRRARGIVFAAAALLLASVITLVSRPAHADTPPPVTCAQTLAPLAAGAGTTSACWADVAPYPFGSDGHAVDPAKCSTPDGIVIGCYLSVTSFAFRSWNRGLARTAGSGSGAANNPFGLWIFNGTRWYPDPTFPGNKTCSGSTVVWAGKLDYWLIGAGGSWSGVCRFDGLDFLWEPLSLPKATVSRGKALDATIAGGDPGSTGITTGTCRTWDDCWFFGTYGTIVHWNGKALSDASPAATASWLGTEFTSAAIRTAADGSSRGIAVGSSSFGSASRGGPLTVQPDGSPPPQIYTATPSGWAPSDVEPPGDPLPEDPFRTDLVAVDLDSAGEGWMAGNPAGWRIAASTPIGRVTADAPDPAPLVPFGTPTCVGPPPDRFTHAVGAAAASTDSFLWSSIGALPDAGGAIAGGEITPATGPSEPVLVQTDCAGNSTVTQFRVADPTTPGALVPASRGSSIKALSTSAANDGWAATGAGVLADGTVEQPHLYHFTDGRAPAAPAGDDVEPRPLDLQQDPPIVVYDPLPPPPPPPPPDVTTTTKTLPPAIGSIKAKLLVTTKRIKTTVKRGDHKVRIVRFQQKLTLKLTFTVRRQVMLGLTAFRGSRTVASSKLHRYSPPHGQILLKLTRTHWPKRFAFTTDAPTGSVVSPGAVLSGTVQLAANAKAIAGRTVASVGFQYSPAGTDGWKDIGTATARPFTVPFDTTKIADGSYDLRLVVTDSTGRVGLSPTLTARTIQNGPSQ